MSGASSHSASALRKRLVAAARRVAAGACVAMGLAGCSPAVLLNALVPNDGYSIRPGLAYGPAAHQKLDVYVPDGGWNDPRPILVFLYGGSWKSGDRDLYRFIGEAFTRLGHVVVVPDYALYPDAQFPAFVEDSARAVAWVREHAREFGGDADRIVLVGHSAGAHIAALLMTDRRYLAEAGVPTAAIRAGVGLAGPYAINPLEYEGIRPVFASVDDPDTARPVAFVDGEEPPMLLLHGLADDTVKPINSRRMADVVREAGGRAELLLYPDVGHIGIVVSLSAPFRGRDSVYHDVATFLHSATAGTVSVLPAAE